MLYHAKPVRWVSHLVVVNLSVNKYVKEGSSPVAFHLLVQRCEILFVTFLCIGGVEADVSPVTYPAYKAIYPSIRLEAMRDGIVDYELLHMYAEKYPEEARELVRTTVYGFEHYDINIGEFRKKRRNILKALSE